MPTNRRFVLLALGALACGGPGDATDAGADVVYGKKPIDAGTFEAEAAPKQPLSRLSAHGGSVLANAHVRVVYVGTQGVDASPSFDAYLAWLVTSPDYWGAILGQYGVGYETIDGSTFVDEDVFFPAGMIQNGLVNWVALDQRLHDLVHGAASDAGADGGGPVIPSADAYVVFLPYGVNVTLGSAQTCVDAAGYHDYDGEEPYAVIPPCGREGLAISHEMAEMATDPVPGSAWYSDSDQGNAGGEIGDLCNDLTSIDGQPVTQLWSNADGDCEPP